MTKGGTKEPGISGLLDLVRVDEIFLQGASKRTLLDIAEFILNEPWQYTTKEYRDAVAVLAKYPLASRVNLSCPLRSRELIEKERAKAYDRRCARCGLIITAEKSIQEGYGSLCRRKVGTGVCHMAQSSSEPEGRGLHVKVRKGGRPDG